MFVSLDLETTGIDPTKDKIIEFGAIKFDLSGKKETLSFLINPGVKLPQIITHITHIKDEDLKDKPYITEKISEIEAFIGNLPIIGHNIQFDLGFLQNIGIEIKNPSYDTFELANILLPKLPSYSLEILSNVIGLEHKEKHRALDDAIAAMDLFTKLTKKFQELPEDIFEEAKELMKRSSWQMKDFLLALPHLKSTTSLINSKESNQEIVDIKTDISPIVSQNSSSLIETSLNYKDLASAISEKTAGSSYISIPNFTFLELSQALPDTFGKLDSTEKYVSMKRLKDFSKKEFFENHELTAILKFLIWSKQTETGLLKEVSLFNKEKPIVYKINCDKDIVNTEEEPFIQKALKKDNSKPIICSHNYIIEKRPHIDHLVILDFDTFGRDIFFQTSTYLKLEICLDPLNSLKEILKTNQTIEALINKTTILFGLIGLLYKNYREDTQYYQSLILSNNLFDKKEWIDINSSINNLIEISKALGEINTTETIGYLQKWKKILTELKAMFSNPDLENHLIEILEDQNMTVSITKSPTSIKSHLKEILDNCKSYKIVDECLDLNDNAEFTKKTFGLDPGLELIKLSDKKSTPEIIIKHDDEPEISYVTNYLKETKSPSVILFTSKKQLEFFTLKLSKILATENINIISQTTGSPQKSAEKFKMDPENSLLLITINTWLNFPYTDLVKTLFIEKIPFDPPSNSYFIALSKDFQDSFIEFSLPQAQMKIKKTLNRLTKKDSTAIFLDFRIAEKDYCKPILDMLTSS